MKLWWWTWTLTFVSLASCLSRSYTLAGQIECFHRRHVFTVSSNASNGTSLTYQHTGAVSEPIVTTFDDHLPSLTYCGSVCNVVIISSTDGMIRVLVFPLDSGIGLVSFDYFALDDSFIYREKFLLPNHVPGCTFVYFTEELIAYCLEFQPPRVRAVTLYVKFTNLRDSSILQDASVVSNLRDSTSLSNFVVIVQDKQNDCFPNEGDHVLFLNGGSVFDHSILDGQIYEHTDARIDATCSRVDHIGGRTSCDLAVYCLGRTIVASIQDGEEHTPIIYAEEEYGKTFFCPSKDFVSFRNETLAVHHPNGAQFGTSVSFPFSKIRDGHCVNVTHNFFFVATVSSGVTVVVDFSDGLYRQIGDADPSAVVPTKVKGQLAIVNNGSETDVYHVGLECAVKSLALPGNFVLAASLSTSTIDPCQCTEHFEPADRNITLPGETSTPTTSPTPSPSFASRRQSLTSTESLTPAQTPTSGPTDRQTNSSNPQVVAVLTIAGVVVFMMVVVPVVLVLLCIGVRVHKRSKILVREQTFELAGRSVINGQTIAPSESEESQIHEHEFSSKHKDTQEDEVSLPILHSNLQQSNASLKTEVQEESDLFQEGFGGRDSGSTDTSTTINHPGENLSLELGDAVHENVGNDAAQSSPGGERSSQVITFDADVHQDRYEEQSDSPESTLVNEAPMFVASSTTSVHLPELIGTDNYVDVYTQPLSDTSGASSRLLVPNVPLESTREDHQRPPNEILTYDDESCQSPIQVTGGCQARLLISSCPSITSSSIHHQDIQDRYQQIDGRVNDQRSRQLASECSGMDLWNEEPNNDRHLTNSDDLIRQISSESEESRG